jgi:regulator of vacuolar morphogenesis
MAQLACMDMETILEVVKLLKGLLASTVRSRSQKKIERLGAWIWGVLGRCNDAGQLGSEEISELRELGKRAVGLLVGIRDRSGKAYGCEEEGEEEEGGEEASADWNDLNMGESVGQQTINGTIEHDKSATVASARMLSEAMELELAKAALQEQLSLKDQLQLNGRQVDGEGDEGEEESGDQSLAMSFDEQVCVTLDMIITIIGEVYGQRDLLEFRDMWDDKQAGF